MKKKLITQSDDLIAQWQERVLIRVSEDGKRVEYLNHGISRDWTKPEAIAEDIGFDATGKPTKVNELDEIGVELAKFIEKERGNE